MSCYNNTTYSVGLDSRRTKGKGMMPEITALNRSHECKLGKLTYWNYYTLRGQLYILAKGDSISDCLVYRIAQDCCETERMEVGTIVTPVTVEAIQVRERA